MISYYHNQSASRSALRQGTHSCFWLCFFIITQSSLTSSSYVVESQLKPVKHWMLDLISAAPNISCLMRSEVTCTMRSVQSAMFIWTSVALPDGFLECVSCGDAEADPGTVHTLMCTTQADGARMDVERHHQASCATTASTTDGQIQSPSGLLMIKLLLLFI